MKEATVLARKILQSTFGVDSVALMSEFDLVRKDPLAFGIRALDFGVLGIGGLPMGHFVEIYGKEKAGKSSLLLSSIASAQARGITPLVIDHKASLADDPERARRCGVFPDDVLMLPVKTSEDATVQAKDALQSIFQKGIPLAVYWDDMGLTSTRKRTGEIKKVRSGAAALTKGVVRDDNPIGEKARLMWDFCRALSGICFRTHTPMVVVNHLIAKISTNPRFSGGQTTIGGGGIRAAARMRIKLERTQWIGGSVDKRVGQVVKVTCEASSFSVPWKRSLLYLDFKNGYLDRETTLLNAEEAELVTKSKVGVRGRHWARGTSAKPFADWDASEVDELADVLWAGASVAEGELWDGDSVGDGEEGSAEGFGWDDGSIDER